VEDHCSAILTLLEKGRDGEIYNIGGNRSLPNKTVVEQILAITGKPSSLIEYVTDRPGHDRRYALSSEKLSLETGWKPRMDFERGLKPRWIGIAPIRNGSRTSGAANIIVPRQKLR
jgi:dTDP-glucose 4,6-dehydratase